VFRHESIAARFDPLELLDSQIRKQARKGRGKPSHLATSGANAWERDLMRLFVRNQLRVSLALPFLALLFAIANYAWTPAAYLGMWLTGILLCQLVQLVICRLYETSAGAQSRLSDWLGMLAASEFFMAACWSVPLFFFWQEGNGLQHVFMISVLMTVVAVRILIAANFMPVVLAGTGLITLSIVLRCIMQADALYAIMGAIAVIVEIFFIQLSRRLQSTARDMLIFKSQREKLIHELQAERDRAERARRRAEQASRAKSRFLATMSHELRTPLNAIMGFSEIISSEMLGPLPVPQYRDYASDIHKSGSYLLSLINDILDLSRIEAGKRELREEMVDVRGEARAALHMVEARAREKGLQVEWEFPARLPHLLADSRAVRQIWLNLLSNAVKFTPDGGRIVLRARRTGAGGLEIQVADNGEGIPQTELKTILKSFTRGAAAMTRAVEGAGLGLPIVNGLARLHDARLTIGNRETGGLRVTISFPPRRVLESSRAEILAAQTITSASQRALVALTA